MLRTVAPMALAALVATLTVLTPETSRAQGTQPTPSVAETTVAERATTISRSGRTAPDSERTPPTAPVAPPPPSIDDARTYAFEQIGAAQFDCLDALWQHESDWNPAAENPSSV